MRCPIDETQLQMTDRQGIEIDYCPKCRGVWLDRGELDKIIERSEQEMPTYGKTTERKTYREDEDERYEHGGKHGKRKRGGFLGDLFEFGD